jgi:hypothetical protein
MNSVIIKGIETKQGLNNEGQHKELELNNGLLLTEELNSNDIKTILTELNNGAINTLLTNIIIDNKLQTKTEPIRLDQVISGSSGGMSMYATETAPIVDDNNRNGWLFNKIAVGTDKFNWFFYGAGNTLTTLGDLKSISCFITIDNYQSSLSLPFFIVYTKPTGVNDVSWYKSSILYTLSAGEKIHLGEEIQAWSGVRPKKQSNKRMVEFNVSSTNTLGLDTSIEELLSITIHTPTDAPINTKILVSQVGYDLYTGINLIERRINLRH